MATTSITSVTSFPLATVKEELTKELLITVEDEALIHDIELPPEPAEKLKTSIQIDSLRVVEILCTVDPIVGFKLPSKIVKAGGYTSIEEAVTSLIPKIEKEWTKRNGGTK